MSALLTAAEAYVVLSGAQGGAEPAGPLDRRTMKASYCSHRDHEGAVVFDPIYFGLYWGRNDRARLDACLRVKRQLGANAVQLCVQGGYGDYMAGATFDYRGNPAEYGRLCTYVRDEGFTPVILVGTADGYTHTAIYDGSMARVLDATAHLAGDAWYCSGYEVDMDRGGGYTAKETDDAIALMRAHTGADALLLLWLQPNRCTAASYYGSSKHSKPQPWRPDVQLRWIGTDTEGAWIEADDPYEGDEQGAWYRSHGGEIDGLWYQTPHGADGPSYPSPGGQPGLDPHGKPRYWDRLIEICDRFLPPGTPMPAAEGFIDTSNLTHTSGTAPSLHGAPDWFASPRPRPRPVLCVGETVPYEYSRDQCCDEAVVRCSVDLVGLGVPSHGCWQPKA
jgi:hypothetical protein